MYNDVLMIINENNFILRRSPVTSSHRGAEVRFRDSLIFCNCQLSRIVSSRCWV